MILGIVVNLDDIRVYFLCPPPTLAAGQQSTNPTGGVA
jgi:hypothetical protein